MNKGLSAYLDPVRAMAAAVVFGGHSLLIFGCYDQSSGAGCAVGTMLIPFHMAHSAVILFFVLSGYVITYVATEREFEMSAFAFSRVARIYSVAIPAILLTICVDLLIWSTGNHDEIPAYQYKGWWKYLPLFVLFAN